MKIKPVFILSRGGGVFLDQEGRIEFIKDNDTTQRRVSSSLEELKRGIGTGFTVLDELLVMEPMDLEKIYMEKEEIDCILVYFFGVTPIERLLEFKGPIIAFGGERTPAFALYAVGEERRERKDLYIALDYTEIRRILKALDVKKLLSRTRIALFGLPAPWHLRWYSFPDMEEIRRKLGVQFIPVELRELIEWVKDTDMEKASSLAREWMGWAYRVMEPSMEDVTGSAAIYLAIDRIMAQKGSRAMAINCLEITQSRKFAGEISNPCFAMSQLRDRGIPSACEMDIPGLLTMIILGHLGNRPTFLGNIVHADPDKNTLKISHCILPTRMRGFDEEPLPYTLRDFHGRGNGVTAFVEVPSGMDVTVARAERNMKRMMAVKGRVLSSRDTCFCRNTLTIQIDNVREFIRRAEGNHHAVIMGDYMADLKELGEVLHYESVII